MFYVYLNEGTNGKTFIENVVQAEGGIFAATIEANELLEAQLGSYGGTFAAVTGGILAITVTIVILTLYMVI